MRSLIENIDRVSRGDLLSAEEWNKLRIIIGAIVAEQNSIQSGIGGIFPAPAEMMRIITTNGDYWTCRKFEGGVQGSVDQFVAKPWELRPSVTSIGAQTYSYSDDFTREATEGIETEDQVLTLGVSLNETLIWACQANMTGVTTITNGDPVTWIDLNLAARTWAKVAV